MCCRRSHFTEFGWLLCVNGVRGGECIISGGVREEGQGNRNTPLALWL